MSDEPRLRIAIYGGIGRATLARPSMQNTLDRQSVVELRQALDEVEADGAGRAGLIAGEGGPLSTSWRPMATCGPS